MPDQRVDTNPCLTLIILLDVLAGLDGIATATVQDGIAQCRLDLTMEMVGDDAAPLPSPFRSKMSAKSPIGQTGNFR